MPKAKAKREFLRFIQDFTAIQAVGTSAVRGQPAGTLKTVQQYCSGLHLDLLAEMDRDEYAQWLNTRTRILRSRLPSRRKPWGIARKALNLFMRSCLYNAYLSRESHLARIQRWMEIPLDGAVARGLKKHAGRGQLPRWPGLKRVGPEDSAQYQEHAEQYARELGLPARVFLDNYLWLKNR